MKDHRIGPDLCSDVLDALRRHGFVRGDDEHAGRAILLIGDLARIYEGTQDRPFGPSVNPVPAPQAAPEPPGPDSRDPVVLPASERKNLLIAMGIAADDMRDRAELCTDCPGQTCHLCQSRRRDAQAYDQLSERIYHAPHATPPGHPSPVRQPRAADGKEAGQ